MNSETKNCQNCHQNFTIESEDFAFYEKIKVPPPTFCSKCRLQRRLAFLNFFNLYKRPCGLCKKDFISIYKSDVPYTVYCPKCWWSDDWDRFKYGIDYDFSRPFFEQISDQWKRVPLLGISIDTPTMGDSPYTNHAGHLKNCYLLFHADYIEDSAYGFFVLHNKSIFDCTTIMNCEMCYDMQNSFKNNRCVGGRGNVTESISCFFLRDCDNCQDCFASANLRNKKYHIFNKPYSKEGYVEEMKKWDLGSYEGYQKAKKAAEDHWKTLPPRPKYDTFSTDCTGSYVFQSKNCKESFECANVQDSKFMMIVADGIIKDSYDVTSWGNNMSNCYECSNVGEDVSNVKFCQESGLGLMNAEYSKLSTSNNHFACVAVKKGDYVIFNKKYSKEDYENLRAKIIKHMDEMPYTDGKGSVYKYGEFFPSEMSPFAYEETLADKFFPSGRKEVKGGSHAVTVKSNNLPDHIKDAEDAVLNDIIGCEACGRGYRIIPMELSFLRNMNLPLPRECPFCRIDEKVMRWVGNSRMIPRVCGECGAAFTTNHSEEDAPKILCRDCYLKEVV